MRAAGTEMAQRLRARLPAWGTERAAWIVDAWGRHRAGERGALLERARAAGEDAAARVADTLEALFRFEPEAQRMTPLQIVRTAHREVTAVLADAGIPPIERDPVAARMSPDDVYGLGPDSFADFGDEGLVELHLRWGAAKAALHQSRHG